MSYNTTITAPLLDPLMVRLFLENKCYGRDGENFRVVFLKKNGDRRVLKCMPLTWSPETFGYDYDPWCHGENTCLVSTAGCIMHRQFRSFKMDRVIAINSEANWIKHQRIMWNLNEAEYATDY